MQLFTGAVRGLQVNPSSTEANTTIEKWNTDVEKMNAEKGYRTGAGTFPLPHLKRRYESAHELKEQFAGADEQQKTDLAARLLEIHTETKDYCQQLSQIVGLASARY